MVSFRRVILALAVLALFTGLASAQVIQPGGGSTGGTLSCAVLNTGNPTQVRSEGYAELLGDIVISCTGGTAQAAGSAVPVANITVALNNTIVTSKVFSNSWSEALLLIDEPGAGGTVGPGGLLPQLNCSASTAGIGAGPGGCSTVAGFVGTYYGAVLASAPTTVPNVFQGLVSGNQVIFNGIPILAPVTAGFARVFRITNVRVNANQFAGLPTQGQTPILGSVSISSGVQLSNPVQTLGFLFDGLAGTSVRNATNGAAGTSINIFQCAANSLTAGAVLHFSEGFGTAFKTRVDRTASVSGAGSPPNSLIVAGTFAQNLPSHFLPGAESAFTLPVPGGTAGLTDFGTRVKATFNSVPAGVGIYVSTVNINPLGNGNVDPAAASNLAALASAVATGNFSPVGTSTIAALVSGETATAAPGEAIPLQAVTHTSSGIPLFGPLPVDANGTATAVWEMLLSNPFNVENLDFAVFYTSTANTPPLAPGTVSLSFAPSFAGPTSSTLIPRFTPPSTSTTLINVAPCSYITSLASSANPSSYRQSVTFTASVSASGPIPATITFTDGGTMLGSAPLVSGQATFTTSALTVGSHSIWGLFNGAVIPPLTQTVNKAPTTTTLAAQPTVTGGDPTPLIATVTPAFGGRPPGPSPSVAAASSSRRLSTPPASRDRPPP